MRPRKAVAWSAFVLVLVLLFPSTQFIPVPAAGHREPSAHIYSRYSSSAVTIDGSLNAAEWLGATAVDLTSVPLNSVAAYLLVKNNDTMLFMAYDVVGDTTSDQTDSAGLAFDGDHDGAPTMLGDGEYTIRASDDPGCLPFITPRCHYVYSGSGILWNPEDPMNQAWPFHAGLWAAVGFGTSSRSATGHRMYEFSIPLALLGQPTVTVKPGDVVGFFAGRHVSPYVGVWEGNVSETACWPENRFLGLSEYGHLHLAAQSGVAITPDYSYKPATYSSPAFYALTLTSMGRTSDSFDINLTSSLGWNVVARNSTGALLVDHGGDATLPDVGPLFPGLQLVITVNVTPLPSATPGEVDSTTLQVKPWSNPTSYSTALLRSAVPYTAPWTDALDSGAQGWYVLPRTVNDWELGAPDPMFTWGPAAAHSSPDCWGTGLTGNYSFSSFSILESPQVFILDYVSSATLSFWHWYRLVGGYGDGAWLEVSVDGGDWSLITPDTSYPEMRFGGKPAYAGSSGGWVLTTFNLTGWRGSTLAFRFLLWDFLSNGVSAGWYIDDVSLQTSLPPAGVRLTPRSSYMVGSKLASLDVKLNVQNVGISTDVFDLTYNQVLGWGPAFFYDNGTPLSDSDSDSFVDTGPVASGASTNVTLNITIPVAANPGDTETITMLFRSSLDISVSINGQYKFQVATPIPYMDKMESGVGAWVADSGSMWHQVDSCAPSPPPWFIAYSPCHSWWYGQDIKGTYATGARTYGNLTSPPIELSGATAVRLRFRYWYDTEPTIEYDQRWIMVKVDNDPWPAKGDAGSYQMDLLFYKTWLEHDINLTPYLGHIVQIRFFFDSMDGQNNDHQGWYVDDVNVSAYTPGSLPPNIALRRPFSGDWWTAAVPQDVVWETSDDIDPPSIIRVWVNYSTTGAAPWLPIPSAQNVPGDSSPVSWTPPCMNSTTTALNATAMDTLGYLSWTGPIGTAFDCARPSIINYQPRSPPDVQVKSNVSVTFSEQMNITATQTAFSLKTVAGWVPVAGTFSWTANTVFFTPSTDLSPSTMFQANVSTQAKDVSEPGNQLASLFSWRFTTSSHADTEPNVTIVTPAGGEDWTGTTPARQLFKTLSWTVVDDFDAQVDLKVWVNYSVDGGANSVPVAPSQPFNGTLDRLVWEIPCVNSTEATIGVAAFDTGRRKNQTWSPFFQIDCGPPSVETMEPTGNSVMPSEDVVVVFNESMNQVLTQAAFDLWNLSDWKPIAGTFSWNGNTMAFNPTDDLVRGWEYQVNVTTLATDSSDPGNKLPYDVIWRFTVSPTPPPRVNFTDPANGSTEVPASLKYINVRFTNGVYPCPGAANITPYVNFTVVCVGIALQIKLNGSLSLGTLYTVTLNASRIRDVYGNFLDGNGNGIGGDNYTFSFTTTSNVGNGGDGLSALILALPLVMAGFLLPLAFYIIRSRREDKEERRKRKTKKATEDYADTLGPEVEATGIRPGETEEVETPGEDVNDSSQNPPF